MLKSKMVVAGIIAAVAGPTAHAQAACDRACMRTTVDQYLAAVVQHNPAAAPISYGYRHTENALNKKRGDGVWKSVTGLGKVQRKYFDPVSGQAGYYGIVEEGAKLAIVTARLKIEDRKVTEAEWFIARDGDPGLPGGKPPNLWNPEALTATPPPERVVPRQKRLPREAMVGIVNSYFDGITSHDSSITLARPDCNRFENGTRVTGNRGGDNDGCTSGFAGFNLQNVAARRIPLVDDEAGMVLGMAVFIRRPGSPVRRNAFSEWFIIDDGKIYDIYTAMYYPGPELPVPNWPPFDGNFPLPANTSPTVPAP